MRLVYFVNLSFAACMGLEQHAAFGIATASSTRFAGNLVGSPAFNAQQWRRVVAFSRWHVFCLRCSNSRPATRQLLTWAGMLFFSSHHRLIADPSFVANLILQDAARSCPCSQAFGAVGGACFTCALAGAPTFIGLRHPVSISAQFY